VDEFEACLALRHVRGLGPKTWKRLLEAFSTAANAIDHARSWTERGLTSPRILAEFQGGVWREKAAEEAEQIRKRGLSVLTWADDAYPDLLRTIPDPPLLLYTLGDTRLLRQPCVALVGSRKSSGYGVQMADTIAGSLSKAGICVVSGFAYGIDRAAHLGALREVGSTIAVLGTGIDLVYPASNRDLWTKIVERGLIISEFAPGTKPDAPNFPHRNRIVSGLSLGVLVVEGAIGSGSLITASLALAQNREVFALPGPANLKTFQGCHQLIREGACLVQSGEDILAELRERLRDFTVSSEPAAQCVACAEPEDPEQREVFGALQVNVQTHIDILARQLGWPSEQISTILLFLELQGLVKQLPGMYYTRIQ